MPYRLLFLDLDGTLVGREDVVSPRNLAALNAANEAGCTVVICTGRNRYMVERVAAQWTGHGYGIFVNGAVIAEWETGLVLQKIPVPPDVIKIAVDGTRAAGFGIILFGAHAENDGGRAVYAERGDLHAPWLAINEHRLTLVDDVLSALAPLSLEGRGAGGDGYPAPIAPVSIGVYGERDRIEQVGAAWRESVGDSIDIFCSTDLKYQGWCCYANSKLANKAAAAERVARMLNVPREQIMAIGDHINDIDLLRWAGLGVAMGDAHIDARSAATHITLPQHEDGVADAIERFVLCRF